MTILSPGMPLSDGAYFLSCTCFIAARFKSLYLLGVNILMLDVLPLGSMSQMSSTWPWRPSSLAALGYSGLPQPLMQVAKGAPGGREGLPPLPGFVGFGTGPEPLPNGCDEPPPPFPPPPGDEFDALPTGLPEEARFPASAIAFPEFPPPPGLVAVTGEPAAGLRGDRPEPAANGSSEGMSPFLLAPDGELDALAPGLSEEEGFVRSPIAFPELPPPPGLVAVTGEPAPGDRCRGPEEGFNGSEEGSPLPAEADDESGLFFSGLSEELGFPASFVKSAELPAPLGREGITGGSLFGGSGEGVSGSLAIGVLGVSGELKSCLGAGEGSTGVGGGVAATGGSSGIGGGVTATGGSSGIGGGVTATGGSSGIGGGVAATGGSSGGVGSGGGSGLNVSGGGDTCSGIAGSGWISSTLGSSSTTISIASSANSAGLTNLRLNGSATPCSKVEANRLIARTFLRASSCCCLCVAEIFEKLMPYESPLWMGWQRPRWLPHITRNKRPTAG